MSDVKQLALEAVEGRKEAEKRIPKVIAENLAEYFETEEGDNEYILIKMKRKDDSINSAS